MSMKRTLVVTSLAASLVVGSLAGLPYSEKGLASKFGLTTSVASAATLPNAAILDKLNAIHAELVKDAEGLAAVKAARDKIDALTVSGEIDTKIGLVAPISNKVGPDVSAEELYLVFSKLAINFNTNGEELLNAINDPEVRTIIKKIIVNSGVVNLGNVTVEDFNSFYDAVIAAIINNIRDIAAAAVGNNAVAVKDALKDAIQNDVLDSDELKFSKVLNGLGITINDIDTVQENFSAYINDNGAAKRAAESAVLRYLIADSSTNSGFSTEGLASDGRSIKPVFKIYGVDISALNLIEWSPASVTSDVYYYEGRFVLNPTKSSGTVQITAHDKVLNNLLYSGSLTLTQYEETPPATGGGGGGGPTTPAAVTEANKVIDELKAKLAGATPAEKEELINKAIEAANEAIAKVATIDLSSKITVTDDKATVKPVIADLVKQVQDITNQVKALNNKLKELDPTAKVSSDIVLTLKLGTVASKSAELPLALELLKVAKENGVASIDVVLNGLSISISSEQFAADTTLEVTREDAAVGTKATSLPIASDVYNFEFKTNGSIVTNFTKPISLSIPVANAARFDAELLTLAKIVDGKLIIYVGKFKDGKLEAERNSFSTYTVVENKITFKDTSSVQSWAGRQIQVAAAKGIVEGRGEQEFVPNGQVTRAEFAKLIVKTFGLEDASAKESFNDVNDSDWYKLYVASAVKNGIVNGREAGVFDPNGQITRAEMATMAARALVLTGSTANVANVEAALKGFSDASAINDSLKSGVALAASEGIIVGEEGNLFNPNANSTRAQAAVVIYRLLNK